MRNVITILIALGLLCPNVHAQSLPKQLPLDSNLAIIIAINMSYLPSAPPIPQSQLIESYETTPTALSQAYDSGLSVANMATMSNEVVLQHLTADSCSGNCGQAPGGVPEAGIEISPDLGGMYTSSEGNYSSVSPSVSSAGFSGGGSGQSEEEKAAYSELQSAQSDYSNAANEYQSAALRYNSAVDDNHRAASDLQSAISSLQAQQSRLNAAYDDLNSANRTYDSAANSFNSANQALYESRVTLNRTQAEYERETNRKAELENRLEEVQRQIAAVTEQSRSAVQEMSSDSKKDLEFRISKKAALESAVDDHNGAAEMVNTACNLQAGIDSIQDFLKTAAESDGGGGRVVGIDSAPGRLPLSPGDSGYVTPVSGTSGGWPAGLGSQPVEKSALRCGSIIRVDALSLGETISLSGTPLSLFYFSDRVSGRRADYQLHLPSSNQPVTVGVADRENTLPASALKNGYDLAWDGRDKSGVELIAQARVSVKSGNSTFERFIGNFKPAYLGIGGWSINLVHYLSVAEELIYLGNGGVRTAKGAKAEAGYYHLPSEDGSLIYTFNLRGQHLETRHGLTGALLYAIAYDGDGHLAAVTDSYQNQTTFVREGRRIIVTSPFGQNHLLEIGADGYLASVSNVKGETYKMTYADGGLLSRFQKPAGQVSRFTYDDLGYLKSDEGAGGDASNFKGHVNGQNENAMDLLLSTAEGRQTRFSLIRLPDGGYRRVTQGPIGDVTTLEYKAGQSERMTKNGVETEVQFGPDIRFGSQVNHVSQSRVSSIGLPTQRVTVQQEITGGGAGFNFETLTTKVTNQGRTTTTSYMQALRRSTMTTPEGHKTSSIIDNWGKPVVIQDGSRQPLELTYDRHGRLVSETQGARQTRYIYDSKGHLESTVKATGKAIHFVYDDADRLEVQVMPDGRQVNYTYDANGNLRSVTPPGRPAHSFSFNLLGLLEGYLAPFAEANPGARKTMMTYNKDRQLTRIELPSGDRIIHHYDHRGLLLRRSTSQGDYSFSYGTTGIPESVTAPSGVATRFAFVGSLPSAQIEQFPGGIPVEIRFGYDDHLQVATINLNDDAVAYKYDQDSLPIQAGEESLHWNHAENTLSKVTLAGVSETYGYSPEYGELVSLNANASGQLLYEESMSRDALGRIAQRVERYRGQSTVFDYGYDETGRLISVRKDYQLSSAYVYDSNGNRISGVQGGNRFDARYDEQDRLIRYGAIDFSYDGNGRLSAKASPQGRTALLYDSVGNLLAVTLPLGRKIGYLTDGLDRRVARLVNGVVQERYVYQSSTSVVATLGSRGEMISRFVYGSKLNVPDYMIKQGRIYKIVSDHLGSPRMVVDAKSGEIVQELEYDEFGRVLRDTQPGFQPFGFVGGLYDPETGLVRFGARDYDPETGRWTSKDPILFNGGDTNLYNYVLDDPVNFIDPIGLWSVSVGAYLTYGGGLVLGQNPDGGYFAQVRGGTGLGAGIGWDPAGKSPDYGGSCEESAGRSYGVFAEGGVHVGPAEFGASTSSGWWSNGQPYANHPNMSYGTTPSISFGAGMSVGVEVILHSNRLY